MAGRLAAFLQKGAKVGISPACRRPDAVPARSNQRSAAGIPEWGFPAVRPPPRVSRDERRCPIVEDHAADLRRGSKSARPFSTAAAVAPCPFALRTRTTGRSSIRASSAVELSGPSAAGARRRTDPSRLRPRPDPRRGRLPPAARAKVSGRIAQESRLKQGRPLAAW